MMTESTYAALAIPEIRERADRISAFLALTSLDQASGRIDLVCLAGNGVLACIDHAAQLTRKHGCPLLITGGIGHSTPPLRAAVAARLNCPEKTLIGFGEAELIAHLILAESLLPEDQIILETRSGHTGENAAFTRETLDAQGLVPQQVILVQDPLLQRRTDATFHHLWTDHPAQFFSSPPFVPRLGEAITSESWSVERYLSLLLGEIPRLHDTSEGYGPNGRGFIGHVEIPPTVLDDYAALAADFANQAGR